MGSLLITSMPPALVTFFGYTPGPQCLSSSEGFKFEHRIQGLASGVPSTEENQKEAYPTAIYHHINIFI